MEVRVNGASFAVIMRTPGADRDLAAGFLLAEDVIRSADEIGAIEYCRPSEPSAPSAAQDVEDEGRDNTINVTVIGGAVERLEARLGERRQVTMTSSCGLCGRRTIESLQSRVPEVRGDWTVGADVIASLPDRLRASQAVFDSTGGLHAAGLFDRSGILQLSAEDVGRHNAVDKIAGRTLLAGTASSRHVDPAGVGADVLRAGSEGVTRWHPVDCRGLGAVEPRDRPRDAGEHHALWLRPRPQIQHIQSSVENRQLRAFGHQFAVQSAVAIPTADCQLDCNS